MDLECPNDDFGFDFAFGRDIEEMEAHHVINRSPIQTYDEIVRPSPEPPD